MSIETVQFIDQIMFAFFGLLIAILMTMVAFSGGGGDYFG